MAELLQKKRNFPRCSVRFAGKALCAFCVFCPISAFEMVSAFEIKNAIKVIDPIWQKSYIRCNSGEGLYFARSSCCFGVCFLIAAFQQDSTGCAALHRFADARFFIHHCQIIIKQAAVPEPPGTAAKGGLAIFWQSIRAFPKPQVAVTVTRRKKQESRIRNGTQSCNGW